MGPPQVLVEVHVLGQIVKGCVYVCCVGGNVDTNILNTKHTTRWGGERQGTFHILTKFFRFLSVVMILW